MSRECPTCAGIKGVVASMWPALRSDPSIRRVRSVTISYNVIQLSRRDERTKPAEAGAFVVWGTGCAHGRGASDRSIGERTRGYGMM
jgi:hypothetical protein